MGVYIKDMEMPKNCFDCMFHWHGDGTTYCLAQSKMHDLHHIKWQCKGYEEQMKYREPTCPLAPVPPHGRLIDADALHKLFEEQWDYLQVLDWNENPTAEAIQSGVNWCINTMHDSAPTVIEAEEGET